MTLARFIAGVFLHETNAFSAAAIASFTVALFARATCLETSPEDGLNTSCVLSASVTIFPLIKCPTRDVI